MPAVAKKLAKSAASKPADVVKKPKKQSLKKVQKTADIKAAKKLAKLKSTKAVSDKLNRASVVKKQKSKHGFDATRLNRGVILIQNLPKGFFEDQLKQYFSQYGQVTRYRVARSEKTGGSKGFAYVEFAYPEVAKVAAESMNGYLMFRQRLKTVYIPPDKQDHDYFKQPVKLFKTKDGMTKLVTPATIRAEQAVENYNKPVTPEAHANRVERSKYKLKLLEKKLAKAGIAIDLSEQMYSTESPSSTGKNAKNLPKSEKVKGNKEKPKLKKSVANDKVDSTKLAKKAKIQPKLEAVKVKKDKLKLKMANLKSKSTSEEPAIPVKKKAKTEIKLETVKAKKEKLKPKKVVVNDQVPADAPITSKKKKAKTELKSETIKAKKVKPTLKKANGTLTSVKEVKVANKKAKEELTSKKIKSKKINRSKIY